MTQGRAELTGNESLYDLAPVVLWAEFDWGKRAAVVDSMRGRLGFGKRWSFGGAYVFWRVPDQGRPGEVLYIGETDSFTSRIAAHLNGPAVSGNQHGNLAAEFTKHGSPRVGLALLLVDPNHLPVISPPEGDALEAGVEKRAGEALEALAMRAHLNSKGARPRFNTREDEATGTHDHDTARFQSLVKFLMNDDASRDFRTFALMDEGQEIHSHLDAALTEFERKNLL